MASGCVSLVAVDTWIVVVILCVCMTGAKVERVKMSQKLMFGARSRMEHLSVEGSNHGSFIVGGRESKQGAYPWIISVQVWSRSRGGRWIHACGGVIVNENVAVTAGHCLKFYHKGRPHRVAAGWHRLQDYLPNQQNIDVRNIKMHHKYALRHGVGINDIALLFLKGNFTFNPYVQPATFTLDDTPREGERCEVAGWGRTNGFSSRLPPTLRSTSQPVISLDLCRQLWSINMNIGIEDSNLCVFSALDGVSKISNVCNGDSGGPLMCNGVTVGLVSWGRAGCFGCSPDVYTRLSSFLPWIQRHAPPPATSKIIVDKQQDLLQFF